MSERVRLGDRRGRASGPGQSEGHAASNERDQDKRDDGDPKYGQHHARAVPRSVGISTPSSLSTS
jgi:hypothetical protein